MGDIVDRAMEIGSAFLAWTEETGPCPINIVDTSTSWGKRLCALFEKQAELETEIERLQSELKAANEDADRLAKGLEYFFSENGGVVYYDISPALIAHNSRVIDVKMTRGGNGSHWEGCEDVHYDCKIVQLEAQLKAATDAAKELYACLKTVFDLVDLPLETEEYVGDVIKWNKQYGEGEE